MTWKGVSRAAGGHQRRQCQSANQCHSPCPHRCASPHPHPHCRPSAPPGGAQCPGAPRRRHARASRCAVRRSLVPAGATPGPAGRLAPTRRSPASAPSLRHSQVCNPPQAKTDVAPAPRRQARPSGPWPAWRCAQRRGCAKNRGRASHTRAGHPYACKGAGSHGRVPYAATPSQSTTTNTSTTPGASGVPKPRRTATLS